MNLGAGSAHLQSVPRGKSLCFCAFNDIAECFLLFFFCFVFYLQFSGNVDAKQRWGGGVEGGMF